MSDAFRFRLRPGGWPDRMALYLSSIFVSLPNFWLGTLLIYVLSVYFHILPNSGDYTDFTVNPLANLQQMIFPALTLGFAFSASVMRTTRSSLLEELNKEYARTAIGRALRHQFLRQWLRFAAALAKNHAVAWAHKLGQIQFI